MIDLDTEHLDVVRRILEAHVPGVEVRVFGSRVSGTARRYSDLDLALVGKAKIDQRCLEVLRDAFSESNLPIQVDVLDWHEISPAFRSVIEKQYEVIQKPGGPKSTSCGMAGEGKTVRVSELITEGSLVVNDGYRAKNSELSHTGIPFARAGNINMGFRFEDADKFPNENLGKVGFKISRAGDVVFTSKGTVGRFAFVHEGTPKFVYSPQLCFWRSQEHKKILPRWLYYWMHGREFQTQCSGLKGQTDMADYVSLRDQRTIQVTIPDISEQQSIAEILGTLDDKIELNRRMSETLEAMARALFKSWFVDFDPVRAKAGGRDPGLPKQIADLFPARLVDSELGEIPEGWEATSFGAVVGQLRESLNPLESPDAKFRHFSIPAFDDGQSPRIDLGENIKSQKSRVAPGSVLLSKLNPEIERVWLVDVQSGDRSVCSTEFLVLQSRSPYGRSYVYCLTRSPVFRQKIEGLVTGTSKSHQRARVGAIFDLDVIRPAEPLLEEFETKAGPLLEKTLTCRREFRTLATLRDTLLPKLISGELRIKDAERFIERAG